MKKRYIISGELTVAVENIIAVVLVPACNNIRIDYGRGQTIFSQLIHFGSAELMQEAYDEIIRMLK